MQNKQILQTTKQILDSWTTGYLEADMNYKFRTKDMLAMFFLYKNGVDARNPDLLGVDNLNTFINPVADDIEKLKEQTRIDLKDLNFLVHNASSLSRFVVRAANRKFLKSNEMATVLDRVVDNSIEFGSGYLKLWMKDGVLKARSIDPTKIFFDQYDFKKGKGILIRRTYQEIADNDEYKNTDKILKDINLKEQGHEAIYLQEMYLPRKGGGTIYAHVSAEHDAVLYTTEFDEEMIYKFDSMKREGFPDALGIGAYERSFNVIVQTKVARERMESVMAVASNLLYQKEIDHEKENLVGNDLTKPDVKGKIIGHKGNPITALNTGGTEQMNLLMTVLGELQQSAGSGLNITDALRGDANSLPSSASGVLATVLAENSSSVLKEVKKAYANFVSMLYDKRIVKFILGVFDSSESLAKYLDPHDMRMIKAEDANFLLAQKEIDHVIVSPFQPFNQFLAREEVRNELKDKEYTSEITLKKIQDEVKGVETFISGELESKAKSLAFYDKQLEVYRANPQIFQDPFYVAGVKVTAGLEGIHELQLENWLRELPETQATQPV